MKTRPPTHPAALPAPGLAAMLASAVWVLSGCAGANMPGALAGAVIGGILGRQVGGGSGRDLATVGGVVAGAAAAIRWTTGT